MCAGAVSCCWTGQTFFHNVCKRNNDPPHKEQTIVCNPPQMPPSSSGPGVWALHRLIAWSIRAFRAFRWLLLNLRFLCGQSRRKCPKLWHPKHSTTKRSNARCGRPVFAMLAHACCCSGCPTDRTYSAPCLPFLFSSWESRNASISVARVMASVRVVAALKNT